MSAAPDGAANPPLFKKSKRRGANIRKRPADDAGGPAVEDGAPAVWGDAIEGPRAAKQARLPAPAPTDSTGAEARGAQKVEYHYRKAMDATRTEEHNAPAAPKTLPPAAAAPPLGASTAGGSDTERTGGGDPERAGGDVYRGQKAYINRAAGTGSMRVGPVRGPTNVRTTSVIDYQPSLCKDYKETGFCGYGDSCIFLHDRSVSKTGWQLEQEFEQQQQGVRRDNPRLWQAAHSDDSGDEGGRRAKAAGDSLPFACLLCRRPFENPVVTRCQHYFCEACALARYRKSPKCFACGAATAGVFKRAKGLPVRGEDDNMDGEAPRDRGLRDARGVLAIAPWPAFYGVRAALASGGFVPEPPYARLLRTLGLFDPIEAPGRAFPAAVYTASTPWARRRPGGEDIVSTLERLSGDLERLSGDLAHDGSRIAAAIGEAFDETARWAVGGVLEHLRDAADRVEARMQREAPASERESGGVGHGLAAGPGSDAAGTWCYYSVETCTMPDGSIETRRVVRDNDGAERTTVSRHYPRGSDQSDEAPTVSTAERTAASQGEKPASS
ncbi:RNA-splicing factor [Coemansia biformis]|uniref:Pre-mRNA-splicing factor CWC24 n=1 Tax=Coemansia biformis TaxID=1286918 RepID=A0A9W7Y9K6_9FUNG|nr:RNA-splicing factor [Coemansia biformis]